MTMNPIDAALQGHTPAVMVPRHEALQPLFSAGHRFLVAESGLWIEAKRSWCHLVWPVALAPESVRMPFGPVERRVDLAFGRLPKWAFAQFMEQARREHPVETAAVVIWNERTQELRFEPCEPITASSGHIRSLWPRLSEGETVAIDLHSHGKLPAFFSGQDRRDIGSEVVVAGVVGRLHHDTPELVISLFVCGLEIAVALPTATVDEALLDGEEAVIVAI